MVTLRTTLIIFAIIWSTEPIFMVIAPMTYLLHTVFIKLVNKAQRVGCGKPRYLSLETKPGEGPALIG